MPKKTPKRLCAFGFLYQCRCGVGPHGVTPTDLSPSRLPIPTHRLICCLYSILQACTKIKIYFALYFLRQYRIILSADTASEVRQMLKPKAQIILDAAKVSAASGGNSEPKQGQRSQSARGFAPKHDAGTATRHYRAFWQRRCRAAAAGAVLKPQGGNCAVLPYIFINKHIPRQRRIGRPAGGCVLLLFGFICFLLLLFF